MGNEGQSDAAHLHTDFMRATSSNAEGFIHKFIQNEGVYTLADIEEWMKKGYVYCDVRELSYFMDTELFNTQILITTPILSVEYLQKRGKVHPGFDAVPLDRHQTDEHFTIRWPRSIPGKVVKVFKGHVGHGNGFIIAYYAKS